MADGRFRGEAEVGREARTADLVENDPLRKSGGPKCCNAQQRLFHDVVGCDPRPERNAHEAAEIRYAHRRRGRRVAVRGARTTTGKIASHWRAGIWVASASVR